VVTNADKVRLTGNKLDEKVYRRHSGYPGGLRSVSAKNLQAKYPERLIEAAVRGMLPKSKLGRKQIKKLKVYRGPKHPHEAQQPRPLKISAAPGARK
jgi:large subunit ribosomal protein L13